MRKACTGLYHVLCVNIMVYSLVLFLLLLFLIFLFVLFCFFLFLSVEQGLCYMCLLLGSFILLVLSNSDVRYLSIDLFFIPTTLFSPFCQFLPQSPHLSPLSPFLFRKGQALHGYQQNMPHQLTVRLSTSPFIMLVN